ncbi:lipase family protein [Aquidulcibacter sp.]|jgi:hypothetical protein|uniref:lipase family protein n=1 Tax=Aquidulcibacter sp. TaxID=2052990 RepID=UPI000BD1085A|nr:lipase family protein [Aquidulcibacter sp.]MCE2891871.1 lipase family protein [Hyphomonadaceae bacterium]MCZ8209890.1 lipase family protein [Aquidulcibacter sp.]OYU52679.1 MAG: hypothetical protein CFE27_04790 [Alphaproteobacteria bacterium PA1]
MDTESPPPKHLITLGPDEAKSLPTWRAAFSERTAELMAKLALLSYETDLEKLSKLLNQGQFTLLASYDQAGSQAFLARADDFAVIAFRGTDSYVDWKTNLMSETVSVDTRLGSVEIHKGFKKAYDRIGAQLLADVNRLVPDTKGLYLTGHSLGGAMAQIASTQLERDNLAACYTFGAPRVGDLSFDRLVVCPHYRFVNGWDLVTTLPPPLFSSYRHTGDPRLLTTLGKPIMRRDRSGFVKIFHTIAGIISFIFGNPRLLDDHRMEAYIDKIKAARALRGEARVGSMFD